MTTSTLGTWRNPPLAYVVAELAISPHYGIGDVIPSIQQSLRKEYPRTVEVNEIVIDGGGSPAIQKIWRLLSEDQTCAVQLGPRAISIHASSYTEFKEFLFRWNNILKAIDDACLGAFAERAGLRYVDLIVPSEGHDTRDYLIEGLQGIQPPDGGSIQNSIWASGFLDNNYLVQARTASPSPAGMLFPPNFAAIPLQKQPIVVEAEKRIAQNQAIGFIDTECSYVVQKLFDTDELNAIFTTLHGKVSSTFKLLISKFAKDEWE